MNYFTLYDSEIIDHIIEEWKKIHEIKENYNISGFIDIVPIEYIYPKIEETIKERIKHYLSVTDKEMINIDEFRRHLSTFLAKKVTESLGSVKYYSILNDRIIDATDVRYVPQRIVDIILDYTIQRMFNKEDIININSKVKDTKEQIYSKIIANLLVSHNGGSNPEHTLFTCLGFKENNSKFKQLLCPKDECPLRVR